jgi:hypothetical protein
MPKSQMSRQNQNQHNLFMEQMNFHKQKLYSLIIAGVALVSLLLPWVSISFGFAGGSFNGFRGWGILSLFGIIGIAASCFMGNKALPFDDTFKKVALGSFAAIGLGALLFFLRLSSAFGGGFGGVSAGIGLWICLVAGVLGIVFLLGIVKLPDPKKPS